MCPSKLESLFTTGRKENINRTRTQNFLKLRIHHWQKLLIYLCLHATKCNETKNKWFLEFPNTNICPQYVLSAGTRSCEEGAMCKVARIYMLSSKLEIRVSQNLAKLGGGSPYGVGGQERNEVNHVTGEGGSNIGSWDVLNLLWIKFEPSALALKRIFWDLNGVAVVSECCIGPIPPCSLHLTLLNVCNYGQKEMGVIVDNCRLIFSCICLIKAHP